MGNLSLRVYYRKPCFPVWLLFYGADVTVRPPGTDNAALVEVVDRGRRTDCVVSCVERGAVWTKSHRMGRPPLFCKGPSKGSLLMPGQVVSG